MPSPQKIKMYYDPRGNVIRTVNPDNSEQWVVHGKPDTLSSIALGSNSWSFAGYTPTPWEAYTYDANDLSTLTSGISYSCDYTPKCVFADPMGRAVKAIDRLSQAPADELVINNTYDIQGNVLTVTDALDRTVFQHKYGIAKQPMWNNHIDSGESTITADAAGKPIEVRDAKGARTLSGCDVTSRPLKLWAKDNTSASFALRNVTAYGESLGISTAASKNMLGKPYQHYDEAGLNELDSCDFKGNPISKFKQILSDATLLASSTTAYQVDWTNMSTAILKLDSFQYWTTTEYDALNRGIKLLLPANYTATSLADYQSTAFRALIEPVFNRAGALQSIQKDGTTYVTDIAYNAKGQQVLAAWNNGVMMRFAHDPLTFRLQRVKAEKYSTTALANGVQYNYNSGTTVYDQAYSYDLVGNILGVSDQTPDSGITNATDSLQRLFEYDALYRLIYANGREMSTQGPAYQFADAPGIGSPTASNCRYYEQEYTYDKIGNIQQLQHRVINNSTQNYTRQFSYNTANNQVTQISTPSSPPLSTFTYDAAGNTLSSNNRVYTWDYKNHMKTFALMAGSTVSTYAQYLYDASGARIKKFVLNPATNAYESVTYIDGVFEYDTSVSAGGSTVQQKNYLHLMGGLEIRIGSFAGDISNTTIYQIADYLGSAGTRLDDTGGIIDKEEYYPYGDSSLRTFSSKRYRYIGKEKDNESGLYQMGARYYAPWMCKFMSVDPLAGKNAHQSSYCYADCKPIMLKDPSGMDAGGDKPQGDGGKKGDSEKKDSSNNTETYEKPDGTSMKLPADTVVDINETGSVNTVNKSGSTIDKNVKIAPGSVTSFTVNGTSYDAYIYVKDGKVTMAGYFDSNGNTYTQGAPSKTEPKDDKSASPSSESDNNTADGKPDSKGSEKSPSDQKNPSPGKPDASNKPGPEIKPAPPTGQGGGKVPFGDKIGPVKDLVGDWAFGGSTLATIGAGIARKGQAILGTVEKTISEGVKGSRLARQIGVTHSMQKQISSASKGIRFLEGVYNAADWLTKKLFWVGALTTLYDMATGKVSMKQGLGDIGIGFIGAWAFEIAAVVATLAEVIGITIGAATLGWILVIGATAYGAYRWYQSKNE